MKQYPDVNKRKENRIYGVFPTFVSYVGSTGRKIKARTIVDNISQDGLFLQLPQDITFGTQLFSLIRINRNLTIAAKGKIVRIQRQKKSLNGFGVCFEQTKLMNFNFFHRIQI